MCCIHVVRLDSFIKGVLTMGQFITVPIESLRLPKGARIRNLQDSHPRYEDLKRNIAVHGIQQSIIVHPYIDPATNKIVPNIYEIVDGLQRTEAARAVKLTKVPVDVRPRLSDDEVSILQITTNEHRIPTSPKDLLDHIKRYAFLHPEMSQRDLAKELGFTEQKLGNILKLKNLHPSLMQQVTDGKIKITHAVALATLPQEYQTEEDVMLQLALPSDQFINYITAKKQAIVKTKATGTTEEVVVYIPLRREAIINKLEVARIALKDAQPNDENYGILTGRVQMAEEILQVDPETLRIKAIAKEQARLEKAKERAEKAAKVAADVLADVKKQSESAASKVTEKTLAESLA